MQGSLLLTWGINHMNLLQKSARAWKEIIEYRYLFVYGYKKQLYPINLIFSLPLHLPFSGLNLQARPREEEVGMEGAIALDTADLKAKYLLIR